MANVVTGPTILMNRELLEEVIPVPEEAVHQDWWIALVAAVVGRTVGLPEATVLYRRHGSNTTHELPDLRRRPVADLVRRAAAVPSRTPALRAWIRASSRQAGALLERFGHRLPPATARALEEMGTLHTCGFLERKGRLLRHYALPQRGLLRNLGLVLRG